MDSISLAGQLRMRGIPILGWITIGRCIRAFHDLGVCHPDLNAHNILLGESGQVFVLDFDRGRIRERGAWEKSVLARLQRSLLKIQRQRSGVNFGERDWEALMAGYEFETRDARRETR